MSNGSTDEARAPLVRPRWVWGGLVLAVGGAALLGLGIALLSWWLSVVGAVVLLAGIAVGLRGGVAYDAHQVSARGELQKVVEGETRKGIVPGEMVHDPDAERASLEAEQTRRVVEQRSRVAGTPPLAPLAGWALVLLAVFLLFSQWELFPTTETGQDNGLRDLGLGILCGLAGLRIVVAGGRHVVAAVVAVLAGVGLVLSGTLAEHTSAMTPWVVTLCGALALLSGVAAFVSPEPMPRD